MHAILSKMAPIKGWVLRIGMAPLKGWVPPIGMRDESWGSYLYHLMILYDVTAGGALGWMIARINEVLRWRWTFRILGIAGFVTVPVAIVALWEPKSVREKRKERQSGKKEYTICVSSFLKFSLHYFVMTI